LLREESGSGRRIRTSTDADPLELSPVLSGQDATDSGRMPAVPASDGDPTDPLGTVEGRRVEREGASGDGVVDRVEAALWEAVRSCRTERDVRTLRRALLDALQQLDEQGEDR
jgi:hypothetical protein